MKPIVYIDVLFITNLLINIILLYVTGKLSVIRINKIRIFLSAALGSIYSVFMFFPNLSVFYSKAAKILSAFALVALSYNIKGVRLYIKTLGIFYIVTLCFGGGVFALFYLTGIGSRMGAIIKNGILYFNLPWQILFASVITSYIIISIVWKNVTRKAANINSYIDLVIFCYDRQVPIRALIDTGNSLKDPISQFPVIVTEYEYLKEVLPDSFSKALENSCEEFEDLNFVTDKLRIIPYSSLGKEKGMLLGFRPDSVLADINECTHHVENVIIGISKIKLSKDGDFHALVNPEAIINI